MRPNCLIALLVIPVWSAQPQDDRAAAVHIVLDSVTPSASRGALVAGDGQTRFEFPAGMGRDGLLPAGSRFRPGHSLLGSFRINAILSPQRFEMDEELVARSGKPRAWLAAHLFANMNSIDFDGDGRAGEYGSAFLSLEPFPSTVSQPFSFQTYRGVFRWYSYAIHGAEDESRVGKAITGGCINLPRAALDQLLPLLRLGDTVKIRAAQEPSPSQSASPKMEK